MEGRVVSGDGGKLTCGFKSKQVRFCAYIPEVQILGFCEGWVAALGRKR